MFSLFLGWTIFACVRNTGNFEVEMLELVDGLDELKDVDNLEVEEVDNLEVVELEEPLKPVLHGTIVRITSKDKPCNLRMSPNKYPAAASGAGSSRQHVVGCGLGEDGDGRSDLWEIFNEASTKVVLPFFIINDCIPLFRISLTLTFL